MLLKGAVRAARRRLGRPSCQVGLRKYKLMHMTSQQGFTQVETIPYDIVHPMLPRSLIRFVQSIAFVFEHAPLIRELCGTLYIWARKPSPSEPRRPRVSLARHRELFGSTSVVVPSHNEEMNIRPVWSRRSFSSMATTSTRSSSSTTTAPTGRRRSRGRWRARHPRVRLVDRRPPNGVGLALRDGIAAATGRYILTMDCDFVQILPEIGDLFDAIAGGRDGAVGSRFSHESVMINYPFFKTLCNRTFHLLVKLLLVWRVHDISNNLKLYRTEIFRAIEIEERHFAANAELGLKPLLAGYDIEEVPISWINRTHRDGQFFVPDREGGAELHAHPRACSLHRLERPAASGHESWRRASEVRPAPGRDCDTVPGLWRHGRHRVS